MLLNKFQFQLKKHLQVDHAWHQTVIWSDMNLLELTENALSFHPTVFDIIRVSVWIQHKYIELRSLRKYVSTELILAVIRSCIAYMAYALFCVAFFESKHTVSS